MRNINYSNYVCNSKITNRYITPTISMKQHQQQQHLYFNKSQTSYELKIFHWIENRKLAAISLVGKYLILMNLLLTVSLTKWYRISINIILFYFLCTQTFIVRSNMINSISYFTLQSPQIHSFFTWFSCHTRNPHIRETNRLPPLTLPRNCCTRHRKQ